MQARASPGCDAAAERMIVDTATITTPQEIGHDHRDTRPRSTSPAIDGGIGLREGYAEVGDQRLHYVEAGEGPLVLLLHGFPEF